jgi:PAP2 superfamily
MPNFSPLCILLCAVAWSVPHCASAQMAAASLPDSPTPAADSFHASDVRPSDSGQPSSLDALPDAPTPSAGYAGQSDRWPVQRESTWGSLLPDFLHDQKDIWLAPGQLAKGHGWVPLLIMAAGTAGFIESDSHVMPYFRDHQRNLDDVNDVFDQWITMGEIAAVPVGVLATGMVRNDSYMKTTALLAARGYADTEVLEYAAKLVTRRERPSDVLAGQNFNHTFFKSALFTSNGSSFPSGHAAGAFVVATVLSTRYKNHKWVPWVMYPFATAISLSRITTLGHFPSDVFVGAAMGYSVSRFEVLRQR